MRNSALSYRDYELWETVEPSPKGRVRFLPFLIVCLLSLAVTCVLFLDGIRASPDILRDEITYWIISHNVAAHASVSLYGSPFVLHPPLVFLVEGAVLRLTGGPNDFLYGTLDARWLFAVAGIITGALILLLSARTTGKLAAIMGLMLFSLDPLVLRTVRRDLLEAPAMVFAMGAVLLLSESRERGLRRPAVAGIMIGLALLMKEYTGFLLALVVVQWLWPRISRRWVLVPQGGLTTGQAAATLGMACLIYALYPLGWLISGHWNLFSQEKLYLLERFLGLIHDTGLNRANTHVTFVSILLLNVKQYASSYILLATGGVSAVWLLLKSRTRSTSVVALWAIVVTVWSAFETVHGLAEEEFYYYDIIPAAITTGALLAHFIYQVRPDRNWRVTWRAVLLTLAALIGFGSMIGYNSAVWARYYASPDDAVLQMRQYLDHHLPKRTIIIAGSEMDGPSFGNDTFRLIRLAHVSEHALSQYKVLQPSDIRNLVRSGAHYVVLSTKDVYLGYGVMSRRASRYVHLHGTIVHSTYSTTYWHIQLIRLNLTSQAKGQPVASGTAGG
jgi:4-amino-4-deoxy-L-arabinose transferase-like glycosyltransferase